VDTDRIIELIATAIMPKGLHRQVKALVKYRPLDYVFEGAFISGGTIKIYGNADIQGVAPGITSDIMANQDIQHQGSAIIGGAVYCNGDYSVVGTPPPPTSINEGVPLMELPSLNVQDYKNLANVVLTSSGNAMNAAGTVTYGVGSWNNFSFSSGIWNVTGDSPAPPPSIIYVETDLDITGKGTWSGTIICEGYIDGRGTGTGMSVTGVYQNVVMVSGKDIKLHGNFTATGFLIAREQVDLNGNATIQNGGVLAIDEYDLCNKVSTTSQVDDSVGGSVKIRYPGDQQIFIKAGNWTALQLQKLVYLQDQ
jgi:hypothetical protein